jgi:hypothetical protein
MDLVCEQDETTCTTILQKLLQELNARGTQQLQFCALSADNLTNLLRKAGFRPLGESSFVLLPADELAGQLGERTCSFMLGHEAD